MNDVRWMQGGCVGGPLSRVNVLLAHVFAVEDCYYTSTLALFPGPTQLSVACSTVKREEPGIFSHVSMT